MNRNRDIKSMSWIKKSEIAERADTLEALEKAKKEAEAQTEHLNIIFDYGVKENGKKRPATPEEKAQFENCAE